MTDQTRPPIHPPPELPPKPSSEPRDRAETGAPHAPLRNPFAAAVLSVFTGLGHVYLGAYERAVMFVLALVTMFLIGVPFLGLFVYFFAIIDAYRQAELLNLSERPPAPPAVRSHARGYGFGLFLIAVGALLLAHNLLDLDLVWLRDWWPAALVAAGLWLTGSVLLERLQARRASVSHDEDAEQRD